MSGPQSPAQEWTLAARWIFPIARPPLEWGCVTIAGNRIAAVEPRGTLTADLDLGNVAILPGLVNAHTHLDLTGLRGQAPPTPDFTAWLRQVIAHRRRRTPEQVQADIQAGVAECLRHGTTLVGDISSDGGSWMWLAGAPVWAVVFREMLGLSAERATRAWADLDCWLEAHAATPTCRPGVSPHSPYSVRASLFAATSTLGVPVAVHLAETLGELQLLGQRRGPIVPFLKELGAWAPDGLADDIGHVLHLCNGLSPTLLVHGNYLPPAAPIPVNASIVYCPRTHAAFGHPPHPFRVFLDRGVRIALGTDSLASNPDLSILEEARFLHRLYPDLPGTVLLRMATLSGAEALGWHAETGSLEPGKSADLVVVPLPETDDGEPHNLVLATDRPVRRVLWRGQWTTGVS